MAKDWTIDTGVLYQTGRPGTAAADFLSRVVDRPQRVAVDKGGLILHEYKICLRKLPFRFLQKWFADVIRKSLMLKKNAGLRNGHIHAFNTMKFHADDWPFVAVCAKTRSRRLVIGLDSDYNQQVVEYLLKHMNVTVNSIDEAMKVR